jgi:hypothetical protein
VARTQFIRRPAKTRSARRFHVFPVEGVSLRMSFTPLDGSDDVIFETGLGEIGHATRMSRAEARREVKSMLSAMDKTHTRIRRGFEKALDWLGSS